MFAAEHFSKQQLAMLPWCNVFELQLQLRMPYPNTNLAPAGGLHGLRNASTMRRTMQ
jgi:hypothetical protein